MGQKDSVNDEEQAASEETFIAEVTPSLREDVTDPAGFPNYDVPERIDRYQIRSVLGRGGFGTVFRAWDPKLEREVALKLPHAKYLEVPQMKDRFLREARAVAGLQHPSICPVHEVHELADGRCLLSLAYIDGKPLSAYLKGGKSLKQKVAAKIVQRIAMALQFAHNNGVIHRDLKPANILLTADGRPILTDFGLARRQHSDATLTQEGDILGTPAYMSPEQAQGKIEDVDQTSDVYSLGATFYEMLTGKRPFEGSTVSVLAQVLRDPPVSPIQLRPKLNPQLAACVLRAMEKKPLDRFPTMEALANAISTALKSNQDSIKKGTDSLNESGNDEQQIIVVNTPSSNSSGSSPNQRKHKSTKILVGAGATLLAIIIGVFLGSGFLMSRNQGQQEEKSTVDNEVHHATSKKPGSELDSPFVGKWRFYSARLSTGSEGEIEFASNGTVRIKIGDEEYGGPEHRSDFDIKFHSAEDEITSTTLLDLSIVDRSQNLQRQPPFTKLSLRNNERWQLERFDAQHFVGRRHEVGHSKATDILGNSFTDVQIDDIALFHHTSPPGPPFLGISSKRVLGRWSTTGISNDPTEFELTEDGEFYTVIEGKRYGGRDGEGGVVQTYRGVTTDDNSSANFHVYSHRPGESSEIVNLANDVQFGSKEEWAVNRHEKGTPINPAELVFSRSVIAFVPKELSEIVNVPTSDGKPRKEKQFRTIIEEVQVKKSFSAKRLQIIKK